MPDRHNSVAFMLEEYKTPSSPDFLEEFEDHWNDAAMRDVSGQSVDSDFAMSDDAGAAESISTEDEMHESEGEEKKKVAVGSNDCAEKPLKSANIVEFWGLKKETMEEKLACTALEAEEREYGEMFQERERAKADKSAHDSLLRKRMLAAQRQQAFRDRRKEVQEQEEHQNPGMSKAEKKRKVSTS